ncbi:hypothetical protein MUK42_34991 [Musa troglodytarum]|uniref:Uncharacterized protein n=1 Tax=Musa troglodytarum TaxID=320322 RepID=A0A9E7FIZ1_9LILI|nr:hypothetical protein MUK42_34991 [Musa troglodytarum]
MWYIPDWTGQGMVSALRYQSGFTSCICETLEPPTPPIFKEFQQHLGQATALTESVNSSNWLLQRMTQQHDL